MYNLYGIGLKAIDSDSIHSIRFDSRIMSCVLKIPPRESETKVSLNVLWQMSQQVTD